jgi:APA family basic amino acid/polyamine antiporter
MFWVTWLVLSIIGFKHNFSLLPVAGILVNMYLMSELGSSNWFIFLIWLIIGLVVYFAYGYRKSKLNELETTSEA